MIITTRRYLRHVAAVVTFLPWLACLLVALPVCGLLSRARCLSDHVPRAVDCLFTLHPAGRWTYLTLMAWIYRPPTR